LYVLGFSKHPWIRQGHWYFIHGVYNWLFPK
jgi:hypothetical protein